MQFELRAAHEPCGNQASGNRCNAEYQAEDEELFVTDADDGQDNNG